MRKLVTEFTTASDTQGQYAGIDITGSTAAEKVLWPHHIVATLPASPVAGFIYYLTTATGSYPTGQYLHDGTGWVCVVQTSAISLPDWAGVNTATEIISGVEYTVTVTAANDQLNNLTLNTSGIVQIVITNASTFVIIDPSSGYKTSATGLYDLSTASVRLSITRTGAEYEYASTPRVAL